VDLVGATVAAGAEVGADRVGATVAAGTGAAGVALGPSPGDTLGRPGAALRVGAATAEGAGAADRVGTATATGAGAARSMVDVTFGATGAGAGVAAEDVAASVMPPTATAATTAPAAIRARRERRTAGTDMELPCRGWKAEHSIHAVPCRFVAANVNEMQTAPLTDSTAYWQAGTARWAAPQAFRCASDRAGHAPPAAV
jgi:hypothetical protein